MTGDHKRWGLYLILAILAAAAWFRLSYPQLAFLNLSVSRSQALQIAKNYLRDEKGLDLNTYHSAAVLIGEHGADRYLQKTLGFDQERAFLLKHRFDLFSWRVRFFKQGEKEEYALGISASTAAITGFLHTIDDTAERPEASMETATALAKDFLSSQCAIDLSEYTIKEQVTKRLDRRTDHTIIWQKNNVAIPWTPQPDAGTGKLLVKIRIAGNEILYFDTAVFDVPDDFRRFIDNAKQSGSILTNLFSLLYFILIGFATYTLVRKRDHTIFSFTQPWYTGAGWILLGLTMLFHLNSLQRILYYYPTTASLKIYFSELTLNALISGIFLAIMMVVPGMSGEALAQENKSHARGFFYYIQGSFFSRHVSVMILQGYLIAVILLGLQAVLFALGQAYAGVWTERPHLTQTSSAIWPFVSIFIIAIRASICEETTYRLFGIEWGKKIWKSTCGAVLVSAVLWGFGHTHYDIFPSWFRGLEVSALGLVLSCVYLQHGIIPAVVAHYLFDIFWGGAGFLFGTAHIFDFLTCLALLVLPLFWAILAWRRNQPDTPVHKDLILSPRQETNLAILRSYLANRDHMKEKTHTLIREELIRCGWDSVVIDRALETRNIQQDH